jgi:hypothetical protein
MKMDDSLYLFIKPGGFDLEHLPRDPQAITVQKASGETIVLDPHQARVDITSEHPQVERMEGDWGAICEVFRKSNYYYVSATGIQLAAGDRVTIRYKDGLGLVTLMVIAIENGRARIEPPEISASSGRQSP